MEDALDSISVSKQIREALVDQTGELYEILNFIKEYENASWQEVSRLMILSKLDMDDVDDIIISTVVPSVLYTLEHMSMKYFGMSSTGFWSMYAMNSFRSRYSSLVS